ncbi:MAG: threonine ammonia-lyase, biosynthetic, partial [Pseudomonadales bacterium]
LGVAGMKKYAARANAKPGPAIAIVSGANMNFDRLRHVSERTEIGERREILLGVTIPERAGSFKRFCNLIGTRAITEFNYRYADTSGAHVLAGIQTAAGGDDRNKLIAKLRENYDVVDLSDNEVAVLHVRHMVGGRAAGIENERLFRFEFPEYPGALLRFLNTLGGGFNITMFHYRNHGSAYGRVLAGVQIADAEMAKFKKSIVGIGYRFWEETDNPAYQLFLG